MTSESVPESVGLSSRRDVLRAGVGAAAAIALGACARVDRSVPVIELWTISLRPWFDAFINERIGAFKAANAGVDVRWIDVPFEAMERKLIAAAAAGRSPDVVNLSDVNFARFVAQGALRNIASDIPAPAASVHFASVLPLCAMGEDPAQRLFALPWYLTPQAVFANQRLLSAGGLTAATVAPTWRGLVGQARDFRKATGKFLFSQPLGDESQVPIMLLGEGLPPVREDGGRLRADLRRPEVAGFVRMWAELYRDGGLPREAATKDHGHVLDLYQDGRIALANTGPTFLKRIQQSAPEVFAETAVLPGVTGELGRVHIPLMLLGVMASSVRPREAAALVSFLTSAESQLAFCRNANIMPSAMVAAADPFFDPPGEAALASAEGKMLLARAMTASYLGTGAAFTAALASWPDMRRAFEEEFKRVLLDGADLDSALTRIESEWEGLLALGGGSMSAVPRPARLPEAERPPRDGSVRPRAAGVRG